MAAVAGKCSICALLSLILGMLVLLEATVVITKGNNSLVFEAAEASFAPQVPNSGICGILISGNPLHACTPLSSEAATSNACSSSQLVLVSRGECPFDTKVRHAQDAGFHAIVVADNMENRDLVTRFHCSCIDAWLTNWRAFCPICKYHIIKAISSPSERTPLLHHNNNRQQQVTLFAEEGVQALRTQETCVNSFDLNSPSLQQDEPCRFSFNQLPSRSSAIMPIGTTRVSRHTSLQSLGVKMSSRQLAHDSVEAFRSSPYFTPPSVFCNSAPNILAPLESSSSDAHYIALNGGSLLESSLLESPQN